MVHRPEPHERRRIRITGTVQGVGFRPFVYREAGALGLIGWVRNDRAGVLIEVEGAPTALDELGRVLLERPPPLARVTSSVVEACGRSTGGEGFHIVATDGAGPSTAPVGVDTAPCAACLAEVADPQDRRYRYPFTNCTDCGPRYTIVRRVPYDRAATTMAGFTMCARCQAEYDDPGDRRFHAQPNACPDCGPRMTLRRPDGTVVAHDHPAIMRAGRVLRDGGIVAVKGLGGYHLATDAGSRTAVAELRRRKHRDDKPFAVMVSSVADADALVLLDSLARAVLASPARPVVLAPVRADALGGGLAPGVAPGLVEMGLILASTPLHHLLLAEVGRPLVMTSGNLSDEPIAHDDEDALVRLGPMVDLLLGHDRPIHIRCDDSVVRSQAGRSHVLRRSRGLAPEPLALPITADRPILAVGAELKSTIAVARGGTVTVSHHIGDLGHLASYRSFLQAIDHLCHLADVVPEVVAHDLHPEYLSTKWAMDLDLDLVGVQHHHAHVASCLVEHGRTDPVVALAFDGTGYGADGQLWGGEVLVADLHGCERAGHLRPLAMPGGVAAIAEPWRMAVAWAAEAGQEVPAGCWPSLEADRRHDLAALVASGQGPVTTSIGRLLDALGSLVTGRTTATFEAQTAMELEALARGIGAGGPPGWDDLVDIDRSGAVPQLDPRRLVAAVIEGRRGAADPSTVAAGVHRAVGTAAATLASEVARDRGLDTVVLTGGVFQNVRLTDVVHDALRAQGLHVLVHHCVPSNDGGISIGQAAVAAAQRP